MRRANNAARANGSNAIAYRHDQQQTTTMHNRLD
jgi:hypothetical protein